MALKSAYNYVRENIDSNFDKYVADNVSYGCEEDIKDIKRWISMLKEWTSRMKTILLQL